MGKIALALILMALGCGSGSSASVDLRGSAPDLLGGDSQPDLADISELQDFSDVQDADACASGSHSCAGVCVSNSSVERCGTSCTPCTAPANATSTCDGTTCGFTCAVGFIGCHADGGAGCETAITTAENCGGCGITCAGGTPVCATSNGVEQCVSGCGGQSPNLCGSTCTDLQVDVNNCGTCGVGCSTNHISANCAGGVCNGACEDGFADCNSDKLSDGCELSIMGVDVRNCGACGTTCSNNHISATCAGGVCNGACDPGYADCNGDKLSDGCETQISGVDPNNCGGCGVTCSNSNITASCTAGVCSGTCAAGYADCDGDKLANGCETLVLGGDVGNCGGCGVVCSNSNLTASCTSGVCDGACAAGYSDCNGDKQMDGCEIQTSGSDATHCGGCGLICSTSNISAACGGGICDGACATGYADCDNNKLSNGCEIHTLGTDVANCGGCGIACSSAHISAACSAGTCSGTCATGYADCDGNKLSDGCETLIGGADINNCGGCGVTCNIAGGESCIAGACGCASGLDCSATCVDNWNDSLNCGTCGNVCQMVTSQSTDLALVGQWHFDEGTGDTASDASGAGNDITLNGSPSWVTGYSGKAIALDGVTQYATAELGAEFGTNTDLSASAWVYVTSTSNGPIFGVAQTLPGTDWDMPFLSINGATVYGWLWQVNGNNPLSATVSLNAWHFLAITYSHGSGGKEIFYVDGVAKGNGTGAYAPSMAIDYFTTFIAGARPTGVNSYLNGTIDEVRAYTRTLSAGEIAVLYNSHQTCSTGACSCSGGLSNCGGICSNTQIDGSNCGSCGNSCNIAGGETCASGVCSCTGGTTCSGVCTDTTSNSNSCGGCGLACPAHTCGSCGSGILAGWHLNEGGGTSSVDSSGNGFAATLSTGAGWAVGHSGEGVTLSGSPSVVSAPIGAWLGNGNDNTFTATAWVLTSKTTNGPIVGITSVPFGGGWNMPFLSINGGTAYAHVWEVNGNAPLSAPVALNGWHFLAVTYDPASGGNENFYVDGQLVATGSGDFQSSDRAVYWSTNIGGWKPPGVNSYFKGELDEVLLFNRALTAGEIQLMYDGRESCSGSACSGTCPTGTDNCSGVCTNFQVDSNNCGSCTNVCTGGTSCVGGTCQ